MGWTVTLESDKIGGILRELGRPGIGGTGVEVFAGAKGNITREAGLMGNVIDNMQGNKGTDVVETNWALVRAKTI